MSRSPVSASDEHGQRLVAVRCDHDVVVGIVLAVTVMNHDAARRAFDRGDRAAEPQLIAECRRQFFDIALAAALHRPPDRAVILQQAMIAEEGDKILGGEVEHLVRRRRPDRRAHRREIVAQQPWRKMVAAEIFAERKACEFPGLVILGALLVEGQDVPQHPEIGRRQQIARLREQALCGLDPVVAAALPFEAAGIGRHRKAHAAFHRLDLEMIEQAVRSG